MIHNMDEETAKLLRKARELVNEEFRCPYSNDDGKENIPCSQPPRKQANSFLPRVQSVKDARLKIRQEWEALKNTTISPVNEIITEKAKEVRQKELRKEILFGVVAYMEVIDGSERDIASWKYVLKALGATVKGNFAKEVTHVVFKNGSLDTYKRAKLLNVHVVSPQWVIACKNSKAKVCERLFPALDTNNYSNSPRVFRRFMEYHSKYYVYDKKTETIIRKSAKNGQQLLVDSLQNLNIRNDNNSLIPKPILCNTTRKDSSNESIVLRLSDESRQNNSSSNAPSVSTSLTKPQDAVELHSKDDRSRSEENNITNNETNKVGENTVTKRKLFAKKPMQESYDRLSQNEILSGRPLQTPALVNPYQTALTNRTITKKKTPPSRNNVLPKTSYKSPPKKQKIGECQSITKDSNVDIYHGILNFHDVYTRTHEMFRPPSKYNNTDHGKCPSLVSTSLHSSENKLLKQIICKLGGYHFKAKVDKTTTHIICGEPRRTVNLLKALARGCWVLNLDWAEKSIAAGRWLGEEQYEMTEFSKIVQRSRLQKQTFGDYYSLDIFDNCGLMYVSDNSSPPKRDLMELIVLCGGKVTSNIFLAKIVIGESYDTCSHCVSEKWVLDSITVGRYKGLEKYHLSNIRNII